MKLRYYQEDALNAIKDALGEGIGKQLIVMPTGSGKTVTFSHVPSRVLPGKMLVLAHREELLTQAQETALAINSKFQIGIEQAENYASLDDDIVVASVQTLGRTDSDRIKRFARDHFATVVIDEAHHAAQESITYTNILDYFTPKLRLGVTATPQRGDGKRLLDTFDEITYFRTIQEMIKEGFLVDVVAHQVKTSVSLQGVATRAGDYASNELAKAVNIKERNDLVVEAYKELADKKKALAFTVDVQHAYDLRDAFREAGYKAEAADGTTDKDERKKILENFSAGKIDVLVNCQLFVEGFDEPSVEAIIFARPTKSPVMYSQVLGRGLRLFDGKDHCIVIDMCDVARGKRPVGVPSLLGLPPGFDLQGTAAMEAIEEYEKLASKSPGEAARVSSMDDIQTSWDKIDLFRPPPLAEEVQEFSDFVWFETGNELFQLTLGNGEKFTIEPDALDRWVITFHKGGKSRTYKPVENMEKAFKRVDKWVREKRSDQINLINVDAPWRQEPPSEGQLKWLRKFGVPITDDMSKGQASAILDKLFEENPKPKRSPAQEYMIRKKQGQW